MTTTRTYEWLPHLDGMIPSSAHGDKLSMYSVALEGWRRGLKLKFFNVRKANKVEVNYSLSYGSKTHKFAVAKGDMVPSEAMKVSKDKELTKKQLENYGVPVPEGISFASEASEEEILEFAQKIGYPIVLKPTDGNLGTGVVPNINSSQSLTDALKYVRGELGFKKVIVEKFIVGEEYRVYVLGNKVLGATNRVPANVIGDGKSTINELIIKKNKARKRNPNLSNRPIKIDKDLMKNLEELKLNLDSVPKLGERIFLRNKSNISSGGDPIDVTDNLTTEMKSVAVNTAKAINDMVQCGVDMIVDKKNNTCAVIEVNSRPGIGAHLFPMEGKARDIPKEVVDFYFPETKSKEKQEFVNKVYFDFNNVFDILRTGIVEEVVVPPILASDWKVKAFVLSGKVQQVGYKSWLQRKALDMNLHGYVEYLSKNQVRAVVGGPKEFHEKFLRTIRSSKPLKAEIDHLDVEECNESIKMGFEIKEKQNEQVKVLEKKLEQQKNLYNKTVKEKKKIEKKYRSITSSRVWVLSSPLRKVATIVKRIR